MRQEAVAYLSNLVFGLWGFLGHLLGHEHNSLKGFQMLSSTWSSFHQEYQSRQLFHPPARNESSHESMWCGSFGQACRASGMSKCHGFPTARKLWNHQWDQSGMINSTRKSIWGEPWRPTLLEALPMQRELYFKKKKELYLKKKKVL